MSHYAVAVFAHDGDFDRLLAPYDENNKDEFVFKEVPFTDIAEYFEKFKKENTSYTFEEYMKAYGYSKEGERYGYWHNPHGYWDWYSLDGKDYLFEPKPGVQLGENQYDYRKNDLDWFPDDYNGYEEDADFWDMYIIGGKEEGYPSIYRREYFLERYKTKEQYLKEMSRTVPWAFITPDGKWHSAGTMGWFALSDETSEDANRYYDEWEAYIKSDDNPYVNLVDCHI